MMNITMIITITSIMTVSMQREALAQYEIEITIELNPHRITKKSPLSADKSDFCFYRNVRLMRFDGLIHSESGCCPSCANHLHSVISISVNVALNEEFSGLHA